MDWCLKIYATKRARSKLSRFIRFVTPLNQSWFERVHETEKQNFNKRITTMVWERLVAQRGQNLPQRTSRYKSKHSHIKKMEAMLEEQALARTKIS